MSPIISRSLVLPPAAPPAPSIRNGSFSTVTSALFKTANKSNYINGKGGNIHWGYVAAGGVAGWSAYEGTEIEVWKTDADNQFVELDGSKGNRGIKQGTRDRLITQSMLPNQIDARPKNGCRAV